MSDPISNVTVTIGDLETTTGALYIEQQNSEIWTDYMSFNRYETDEHRYMMGVASPNGFQGKSVAFVQLASKTLLWICDWTACKMNSQPEIPDPAPPNSDWILLAEYPELARVGVGPDGRTPIYRMSGVYVYGHVGPSDVTVDDVSFPRPPWLENSLDCNMPTEKLTAGLSVPTSTSSSPTGSKMVPLS